MEFYLVSDYDLISGSDLLLDITAKIMISNQMLNSLFLMSCKDPDGVFL